jgi:hypothetical protein
LREDPDLEKDEGVLEEIPEEMEDEVPEDND